VLDKHQLVMRKEEKTKRKEAKEKEKREKESKERTAGTTNEADQEEDGAGGGSGRLITTGQMGEVMQESCSIAYTCAKIYWNKLGEVHKQTTPAATSTTSTKRAQSTQGTTVVGSQT
jgi:hypothetical protein